MNQHIQLQNPRDIYDNVGLAKTMLHCISSILSISTKVALLIKKKNSGAAVLA